jgi:hypothetical protein
MSAKSEFEYIRAHMGEVAWRDDDDQRELIRKGIAYLDQNSVRLYFFTGPQTYQNAARCAAARLRCEYAEEMTDEVF